MGVGRKKVCWAGAAGGSPCALSVTQQTRGPGGEAGGTAPPPAMGLSVSPQAALRLSGEAAGASSTQEVPPQALREQVRAGGQLSAALFGKSLRMFAREQGALWLLRAQHSGWSLLGNCSPEGRRQEGARSPRAQPASPPQGSVWCLCRNSSPAPGPSLSASLRSQAVGPLQAGVAPWGPRPCPGPGEPAPGAGTGGELWAQDPASSVLTLGMAATGGRLASLGSEPAWGAGRSKPVCRELHWPPWWRGPRTLGWLWCHAGGHIPALEEEAGPARPWDHTSLLSTCETPP